MDAAPAPFAVKQRVVVYSAGSWVTGRVLRCTASEGATVILEGGLKRVIEAVPPRMMRDWLEHLRGHPHLFSAWKNRGTTSGDPRDRAPVVGWLICPNEPASRRLDYYRKMRPIFEKVLAEPKTAQVLHESANRQLFSHRHKIWREPEHRVAKPREPSKADRALSWVAHLAPRTFEQHQPGKPPDTTLDTPEVKAQSRLPYYTVFDGNAAGIEELHRISSRGLPRNILLHGPDGSGKRSAVSVFLRKMLQSQLKKVGAASADEKNPSAELPTEAAAPSASSSESKDGHDDAQGETDALLDGFLGHLTLELPSSCLKSDTAFTAMVQPFAKRPLPTTLYQRLIRLAGGNGKKKDAGKMLTRFVILRSFESVAPSLQMTLVKKLDEVESIGLRFLLVAKDAQLVVAQLRANLLTVHLGQLPMDLWLRRLLAVAVAERVGFDREGLVLIATLVSHIDLGAAVDLLQQTFVHTSFVSKANVIKTARKIINADSVVTPNAASSSRSAAVAKNHSSGEDIGPAAKVTGGDIDMLTPRRPIPADMVTPKPTKLLETLVLGRGLRCSICTLPPPCQHLSGPRLVQKARQHIKQLHHDPELPICKSFAVTGTCESTNQAGYCRMHHPKDLFQFVPAPRRCPLCTIPEPCRNCPWFKLRRSVANTAAAATVELSKLKHRGERSTVTVAR